MKHDEPHHALRELARAAGIEVGYRGQDGQPVMSSPAALRAMLAELGIHVEDPARIPDARAALEREHWGECVPPVVVAWIDTAALATGGKAAWLEVPMRVPADLDVDVELELTTERGQVARATGRLFEASPSGHVWPPALGGQCHCVRRGRVEIPGGETGYHRLRWRLGLKEGEATVIAAPVRAWGAPGEVPRRWGVFAPLYAARRPERGAVGDVDGLADLLRWVRGQGGHYVATLPLLAGFLDEPCHPSPYSPASRLFWNELYLAPSGDDADWDAEAARARYGAGSPIAYGDEYRARRARIDREAKAAWADPATRAQMIAAAETGSLLDYAMFRAIGEAEARTWPSWSRWREPPPEPTRWDALPDGVDVARVQSHVFAQWQMQRQLTALATAGGDDGGLYLDLPVGVNADAYEVWRRRDQFLLGLSAGAPPDTLFLGGQDWGLPPVSPWASRKDGHRYLRACVRHHMACARMVRIDHAMGLHRLYCVPRGLSARDGAYLKYPAEELYAILTLESHRFRCALVGEDLGTVPDEVPPMMKRHGLAGLFVTEFAMPAAVGQVPGTPSAQQVACLNTHDTPTFGGWWRGLDIDDRRELGLITDGVVERERVERGDSRAALVAWARGATKTAAKTAVTTAVTTAATTADGKGAARTAAPVSADDDAAAREAMVACTRALAASPAHVALVTVEDLWLEPLAQNVPGTSDERPNWRRPWDRSLDDVLGDAGLAAELAAVAAARPPST